MNIKRINNYHDERFSKIVLNQHGAYLIDDKPYEVEIISDNEAIIKGNNTLYYCKLIDEFRYHAPHITKFYDTNHHLIQSVDDIETIEIALDLIQPSQFYIDQDKLNAISTFIHHSNEIIVQVMKDKDRYISLDGHTRLYYALINGYKKVKAVVCNEENDWTYMFVEEAQRRNIFNVKDMILVNHEDYEILWNEYCDSLFNSK